MRSFAHKGPRSQSTAKLISCRQQTRGRIRYFVCGLHWLAPSIRASNPIHVACPDPMIHKLRKNCSCGKSSKEPASPGNQEVKQRDPAKENRTIVYSWMTDSLALPEIILIAHCAKCYIAVRTFAPIRRISTAPLQFAMRLAAPLT